MENFIFCAVVKKKINKLLSKEMSNIYLKVTIEKKRWAQVFDFICLKYSPAGKFMGSSNSRRYHWIFKLFVAAS